MYHLQTKEGITNFCGYEYIRSVTIPDNTTFGCSSYNEKYVDKVVASRELYLYDFETGMSHNFITHRDYLKMFICNNNLEQCKIMYNYITGNKLDVILEKNKSQSTYVKILKMMNNHEDVFLNQEELPINYLIGCFSKSIFEYMYINKDILKLSDEYKHLLELYNKSRNDIDFLVNTKSEPYRSYVNIHNCLLKMVENGYELTVNLPKCVLPNDKRSQLSYQLVRILSKLKHKIPENDKYSVTLGKYFEQLQQYVDVLKYSIQPDIDTFKYCIDNNIKILNIGELTAIHPNLLKIF